jgi:hypothetical protein
MNIRQAILKAADHIERHPAEFNWNSCDMPGCGTPGCAIGWIGYFYFGGKAVKHERHYLLSTISNTALGVSSGMFYGRMDDFVISWTEDAVRCAVALRGYANKYHPEAKGTDVLIPSSVRAIFDMTPEQIGRELAKV